MKRSSPTPVLVCLWLCLCSRLLLAQTAPSQSESQYEDYTFTTLAGVPEAGLGFFDGTGTTARFNGPAGIGRDAAGNVYLADANNHTIRKISPTGVVTTVAGLAETPGSADEMGAAARFYLPQDVAIDGTGNVFVADAGNNTIRKISPGGQVTTVAGLAGVVGNSDGSGNTARFYFPFSVVVGNGGSLYVVDTGNNTIRQISPEGTVTTVAGSPGQPGSADGTGNAARFRAPQDLVLDASGNFYIADGGNHTIRKMTPDWKVTTIAGLAGTSSTNNGTGSDARFSTPTSLALSASGVLYVTDYDNQVIRQISPAGVVTTLAGIPTVSGSVDGPAAGALFNFPVGLTMDPANETLFVTDAYNHALRKITLTGTVSTLAGLPVVAGTADGRSLAARFSAPQDVAVDPSGNVFVADQSNCTIRKITPGGTVSTLAGLARTAGTADGTGSAARFYLPVGVAVDAAGTVYVADTSNHTIRKISPEGVVMTLAGSAGVSGAADGAGSAARFNRPFRVAVDMAGFVYVSDTSNHTIRKISPAGLVSTIAGSPGLTGSSDGQGSQARFFYPEGLALDTSGNIYVADDGNQTIRKITPTGLVTTLAGTAGNRGSADGLGAAASFNYPFGLAVDHLGNVYVADSSNYLVRKITPAGLVTTLGGVPLHAGNSNGTGRAARFGSPAGLAVDAQGNLYVADPGQNVIRKGYLPLPDQPTVARSAEPQSNLVLLDVTNRTTTSWSWTVVRRPDHSSAELSAASQQNPTFTPDVDDLFVVRFQGWDESGRLAVGTVQIPQAASQPSARLSLELTTAGGVLSAGLRLESAPGLSGQIDQSSDLKSWTPWMRFVTTNSVQQFELGSSSSAQLFFRASFP